MPTRLTQFGHQTVRLDARADRLDPRDRPYAPPVASLPPRWPTDAALRRLLPAYVQQGLVLDQGGQGACTGYGLAAVVNFLLWMRDGARHHGVSPFMLYDLARFYDEWTGEQYEGSSCRGAIKGWSKHGSCAAPLWRASVHGDAEHAYRPDQRWAQDAATRPLGVYYRVDSASITDLQAALHAVGALYVSAALHGGWSLAPVRVLSSGHAGLPVIAWDGLPEDAGSHAFAIVGYNEHGFIVQNSWGAAWGAGGFAVLRYDDWRANGVDAWVAALGVPHASVAPAIAASAPSALELDGVDQPMRTRRIGASLASGDMPALVNPALAAALPWSTDTAYAHTLVSGNNGALRSSRPDIGRAADLVDLAVREHLGDWLLGAGRTSRKIVIYAHGGLNAESASIKRIRVMGPYFAANGIYPLFYTWRTGVLETLGGVLADAIGEGLAPSLAGRRFSEASDGLLEAVAHNLRWSWREMKANAALAAQDGGALALLAQALAGVRDHHPGLELHLAGHSAGAFVLGHLLNLCRARALPVASVTLSAPACPLAFAAATFQAAVDAGVVGRDRFWLHLLSDFDERDDTVGPYGKSLLYLVARGFEEVRKTPLAGLQRVLDPAAMQPDDDLWRPEDWQQVQAWRAWVAALPAQADGAPACEISSGRVTVSPQRTVKAGHSTFDNDLRILTRSINRMLGRPPGAALAVPVTDLDY